MNNSDSNFRDPEIKEKKTSFLNDRQSELTPRGPIGNLLSEAETKSELTIHKEV